MKSASIESSHLLLRNMRKEGETDKDFQKTFGENQSMYLETNSQRKERELWFLTSKVNGMR